MSMNGGILRLATHFCLREKSRTVTMGNAVYSQTVGNSVDYYETPEYSLIEQKEGYEKRKYEASMWTSARMEKSEMTDEKMNSTAFWSLFNYISGKTNVEKQKVSMTTPVVVKNDADGNLGMKMSFFLPKENQEKPPEPSEGHVATDPWPVTEFYVRKFSPPNSKIEHFLTEKEEMVKAMTRDGIQLKDNFEWMRAGYDPPFKIANRRSEVWIPVDQVVLPDQINVAATASVVEPVPSSE